MKKIAACIASMVFGRISFPDRLCGPLGLMRMSRLFWTS